MEFDFQIQREEKDISIYMTLNKLLVRHIMANQRRA